MTQPIREFVSHNLGKNAKVRIYPTHLELDKPRSKSAAAATLTLGASLFIPRKHDVETLPIKAVQAVNVHSRGMGRNSDLTITTASGVIEARVSPAEAESIKTTLLQLMNA